MAQGDLVVVLVNRHYDASKWTGILTSTGVPSRRAMAVNRRSGVPSQDYPIAWNDVILFVRRAIMEPSTQT